MRGLREPVGQRLAVESEPAAWTAETDSAELGCVLVDPIALDAEQSRNMGSINKSRSALRASARSHQLSDPLGDLLDVVGI
jgi:hypothetical protein